MLLCQLVRNSSVESESARELVEEEEEDDDEYDHVEDELVVALAVLDHAVDAAHAALEQVLRAVEVKALSDEKQNKTKQTSYKIVSLREATANRTKTNHRVDVVVLIL